MWMSIWTALRPNHHHHRTSLAHFSLVVSKFSTAPLPAAESAVPWSHSVFSNKVEGESWGSMWPSTGLWALGLGLAAKLTREGLANTPCCMWEQAKEWAVCVCVCVCEGPYERFWLPQGKSFTWAKEPASFCVCACLFLYSFRTNVS